MQKVPTKKLDSRKTGSDNGDKNSHDKEACSHFYSVIKEAPNNSTGTIENVLEDSHNCIEMVIIDESQTISFTVG